MSFSIGRQRPERLLYSGKENRRCADGYGEGLCSTDQPSLAQVSADAATPDAVKTPLTSKSHIDLWDTTSETVIIFDWDDTLCPTTFIWNHPQLNWYEVAPCFDDSSEMETQFKDTLREQLEQHQSAVIALLRLAVSLGQVAIVTLAQVGWVEQSCRNFMPQVAEVLFELGIEVVYARQAIPSRYLRRAHEEQNDLTKVLKTRAMSRTIKKFYTTVGGGERSWKNILSIGDSAAERLALQDVIMRREQRDSRGVPKECRCKVVKLLYEPDLERLTAEVQVLITWLLTLTCQDDDIDIDFADIDDTPDTPSVVRKADGHDLEELRSYADRVETPQVSSKEP